MEITDKDYQMEKLKINDNNYQIFCNAQRAEAAAEQLMLQGISIQRIEITAADTVIHIQNGCPENIEPVSTYRSGNRIRQRYQYMQVTIEKWSDCIIKKGATA